MSNPLRREQKIAARQHVAAQLSGAISLTERKIIAFATMGFIARFRWLLFGTLPTV